MREIRSRRTRHDKKEKIWKGRRHADHTSQESVSPGQSCRSWRDLTTTLRYPTCLARHLDTRKLQETDCCCNERNHYSWHFSRNYSIDSLMNREPATETMHKRLASTKKVQITHDVDDADVSIRASLAWEEVARVTLNLASQAGIN